MGRRWNRFVDSMRLARATPVKRGPSRPLVMLAATLTLIAGSVVVAPSAQAQTCSDTKYASWGAASICLTDSRRTVTVKTLDRAEDGYCVYLYVGARMEDGDMWGFYWVATNCAENEWKTVTKTLNTATHKLRACSAYLFRGEPEYSPRYMTIWRELAGVPVPDDCVW